MTEQSPSLFNSLGNWKTGVQVIHAMPVQVSTMRSLDGPSDSQRLAKFLNITETGGKPRTSFVEL